MKAIRRSGGFTIVETLITLAVTSALFISAAIMIGGRQNRTQFNQGVEIIRGSIQQVMNSVSNGYFPNSDNIKCSDNAGAPKAQSAPGGVGNGNQGTNEECVFFGKAMQFQVGTSDPEIYNAYTLVGLRGTPGQADAYSTLAQINPKTVPSMFDTFSMPYSMTVSYLKSGGSDIGYVAFGSSFGALGAGDTTQQVNIYAIPPAYSWPNVHKDQATGMSDIDARIQSATLNPPNGVQLCVNSGGTSQSVLYNIGVAGHQNSVESQIYNNRDCR